MIPGQKWILAGLCCSATTNLYDKLQLQELLAELDAKKAEVDKFCNER